MEKKINAPPSAWTIIEKFRGSGRHYMARMRCICGTERVARVDAVTSGRTRSCGCMRIQNISAAQRVHGGRVNHPREYKSWQEMRTRCLNSNNKKFPDYGGRGITICDRWNSFENFLCDMGPRPPGTTLGRANNDGPYHPDNCSWETPKQQSNNTRRSLLIESDGKTQTAAQWSDETGIKRATIQRRFHAGKSSAEILSPV